MPLLFSVGRKMAQFCYGVAGFSNSLSLTVIHVLRRTDCHELRIIKVR